MISSTVTTSFISQIFLWI